MKKIYLYILLLVTAIVWGGCDSFLETEPKQQIPQGDAYKSPADADVALNGIYNQLGNYRFAGNYVISIGDFCADISLADGSSGHFVAMNTYSFADTSGELSSVWGYGYKIISGTTALLSKIDELVKNYPSEAENLYKIKAQAYGIRAYVYFKMVNIFGLPYGTDNNPHGGLVLMESEPIPLFQDVSRESVVKTYELIDRDIKNAKEAFSKGGQQLNQYYMNEAAVYALSARVALFKKDYGNAKADANKALALRKSKGVSNEDYQLKIWSSTAISEEDIFTIVKSSDDNLSANSINTLYGSYGGTVINSFIADFADTDIRKKLIKGQRPMKFAGIPGAAAVNNIPQFRVSEMYLILAEVKANESDIAGAAEDLLYTAKRNTAITTVADLPKTKEDILAFIAKERKREFFQEGHRLFDVRRTGEIINVVDDTYKNFNAQKFVFPIPADEINSGFKAEQNEGWFNNLPK